MVENIIFFVFGAVIGAFASWGFGRVNYEKAKKDSEKTTKEVKEHITTATKGMMTEEDINNRDREFIEELGKLVEEDSV